LNRLIWWILFLAPLPYVQAIYAIRHAGTPRDVSTGLFPAALLLTVAIAVGTMILRKRALVDRIQSGDVDLSTPDGLGKLFTPFVLNLVLSEAVAIFGLVLSLLSNEPLYTVGFVAASLALMYVHRPTASELQQEAASGSPGAP
jgi:hypothetical protein